MIQSLKKLNQRQFSSVTLRGYQPFDALKDHMQRAKAFVFATEEGFGIIPVEAQACGTHIMAFGRGGALETVIDNTTGLFFDEQSVESIVGAVKRFELTRAMFSSNDTILHVDSFYLQWFAAELKSFCEQKLSI